MSNKRHSASNRHQPYGNPSQPSTGPSIPNVPADPLHHSQGSSNSFSTSSSINVGLESTTNSVNIMEPAISFRDLLSESFRIDTLLGNDDFYDSVISEANIQTQLPHQSIISASAQQHSSNILEYIFNYNVLVDTLTPPAFGMVKCIKEDRFGGVYEVSDARGELSVMKVPKPTREPWRVQREVDCLNLVQGSPNVVEFLDEINTPFEKCIRTKMCLMNFLQLYQNRNAKRNAITVPESRRFARQILIGLRFIHSTGVIHRGLTMDNILVDVVDSNVVLKIAGFGSAVIAGADTT
ncbi:MAG: kinase-like domain-containing protein [Linnemannia gamsii]|nr:MAG: kinase-like domain-containing protein [Linnemannia gamsii]